MATTKPLEMPVNDASLVHSDGVLQKSLIVAEYHISGRSDCPLFATAEWIGSYLAAALPSVSLVVHPWHRTEWANERARLLGTLRSAPKSVTPRALAESSHVVWTAPCTLVGSLTDFQNLVWIAQIPFSNAFQIIHKYGTGCSWLISEVDLHNATEENTELSQKLYENLLTQREAVVRFPEK